MDYGKGIGGAFIGALVGAVIWWILSFALGAELGFFAIPVGAAVGGGTRLLARPQKGLDFGAIAVVVTLLAALVGKYIAVQVALNRQLGIATAEKVVLTEDNMLTLQAKTIAGERARFGKKMAWPAGKNAFDAKTLSDFPADVAQEATAKWNAKSATEKERAKTYAEDQEMRVKAGQVTVRQQSGRGTFTALDFLWILLALPAAFFLGAGSLKSGDGDDDDEPFDAGGGLLKASDA